MEVTYTDRIVTMVTIILVTVRMVTIILGLVQVPVLGPVQGLVLGLGLGLVNMRIGQIRLNIVEVMRTRRMMKIFKEKN